MKTDVYRRRQHHLRWVPVAFVVFSGCVTLVPATTLSSPEPVRSTIRGTAWIGNVTISDPDMTRRETMAASLAASLQDYVGQARYFDVVKSLPGKPASGEYILNFDFDRCRQTRSLLPYYVPAAIATVTIYIWAGGPIMRDEVEISGTLTINRQDGTVLGKAHAVVKETHRRGIYSKEYLSGSSITERTSVIKKLLDQATASLKGEVR